MAGGGAGGGAVRLGEESQVRSSASPAEAVFTAMVA